MCCNIILWLQGWIFPHYGDYLIKVCGKLLEKCGKMRYTITSICEKLKIKE